MSRDCTTTAAPIQLPTQRVTATREIPVLDQQNNQVRTHRVLPGDEPASFLERDERDAAGELWLSTYILGHDQSGAWVYTWVEAMC